MKSKVYLAKAKNLYVKEFKKKHKTEHRKMKKSKKVFKNKESKK